MPITSWRNDINSDTIQRKRERRFLPPSPEESMWRGSCKKSKQWEEMNKSLEEIWEQSRRTRRKKCLRVIWAMKNGFAEWLQAQKLAQSNLAGSTAAFSLILMKGRLEPLHVLCVFVQVLCLLCSEDENQSFSHSTDSQSDPSTNDLMSVSRGGCLIQRPHFLNVQKCESFTTLRKICMKAQLQSLTTFVLHIYTLYSFNT